MKIDSAARVDYYYLVFSNPSVDLNCKIKFVSFFGCFENCVRNDERWLIQKLWENDDKRHIRNIQIKYKIIIIEQYTIAEGVALSVQHH